MTSQTAENWHPQDIIASLRKRGSSLAALAKANGMSRFTFYGALERPYPKVHQIIADELDLSRSAIWPSFYAADDSRKLIIKRSGLVSRSAA